MGVWLVSDCRHTFASMHVPLTAVCKDNTSLMTKARGRLTCVIPRMQDEKARADRAAARVRDVKAWRNEASDRAGALKDLRVARNRGVLRAHERLNRALTKQKDDDRTRRMEALKARALAVV